MATIALDVAGVVQVVEWPDPPDAITLKCGAALVGGTLARPPAAGVWEQATGASAAAAAGAHLLLRSGAAGEQVTGIKRGVVDGFTITQAYNAAAYISDTGTVADTVGTATVQIGRVVEGTAHLIAGGGTPDKLLRIDIPV